jgi:hypothetical protein
MRRLVPVSPQTRVTMACSNRGGLRVELEAGTHFAIENWFGPSLRVGRLAVRLNRQRCD